LQFELHQYGSSAHTIHPMRLVVLSAGAMDPPVNMSTLAPALEESLASMPDATLVRPPAARLGTVRQATPAWLNAIRTVRRADMVFWLQMSSRPVMPIWGLGYVRPKARKSAFVIDAWRGSVSKIRELARVQGVRPCFIAFREAWEELSTSDRSGRFVWMPFGIDPAVFRDYGETRDVFAYWMGRRYEPLHRALVAYCEERGLMYRYSRRGGEFADPRDLGRLVSRSRYFVVTPPDLDNAARTGGYSPFVMRYLEGLAGGTRLLGVPPNPEEFDALLPRNVLTEVAPDGSDLAAVLDAEAVETHDHSVAGAQQWVHRYHTWQSRATAMYHSMNGGPTEPAWPPPRAAHAMAAGVVP
jgi:hypothetical protein